MERKEEIKTILFLLLCVALAVGVFFRVGAKPAEEAKPEPTLRPPREETMHVVLTPMPVTPTPMPAEAASAGKEAAQPRIIAASDETESGKPETGRAAAAAPLEETYGIYRPDVPLDAELQMALYEICEGAGVNMDLALGLIETESTFRVDAVSETGCYGLCQLSPAYFPTDLDPAGNMRYGIGWLGELINQYRDVALALTIYHVGHDDGTRNYANVVLGCARAWGYKE